MSLKDKVIDEIKKIYDPEIPVNIYELGLTYDVTIDKDNKVKQERIKHQHDKFAEFDKWFAKLEKRYNEEQENKYY